MAPAPHTVKIVAHVGDSPPRPDGFAKVSGSATYVDDIKLPGMIHGATLRSPHPHATLRGITWNPKLVDHGAVAVTASDIPGENGVLLIDDEWPVLAEGIVRHVGEPVALVAAASRLDAHRALTGFEIDYEPLAPVLSWEDAEQWESLHELKLDRGDAQQALACADRTIAKTLTTGHQEHIYVEPQGMIARFEDDGTLVVTGSMQCPYYVHRSLMHALALPRHKVRVIAAAIGGGFGGKEDYPSMIAIHAALLSRAAQRPVKMIYDRHEDIVATTKRHPALMRYRAGYDKTGRLEAMAIEILLDGGAYRTLSPVVLSRGVLHATGPYRCPNVQIRARVLRTNTATNGAFRGFGTPQVIFGIERLMDAVARDVGIDPLTVRERNVVDVGDSLATGQVLDASTSARECLDRVAKRSDYRTRWAELERARSIRGDGEQLRGLGLSLFLHGAGFTGRGEHRMRSPVTVELDNNGRILLLTAQTDMGQGAIITLPLIAAEAAGISLDDVRLVNPDTAVVPDSGPTVASRTTMVVGKTLARAAVKLRDRVLDWLVEREETETTRRAALRRSLEVREGKILDPNGAVLGAFRAIASQCYDDRGSLRLTVHNDPPAWQTFDDKTYQGVAYATYGWGANVVEVELNPDTLETSPVRAHVVCEVGKAIHPGIVRGQLEGGTLQGIGYGYLEQMKLDGGRYLNDRLATYIIPTIKDCPAIEVEMLENGWREGPFGAKGLGELPMDGPAPAVAAAIENASGIVPDAIPATPERLLRWEMEHQVVGDGAPQSEG